jgi:hypothetical protein
VAEEFLFEFDKLPDASFREFRLFEGLAARIPAAPHLTSPLVIITLFDSLRLTIYRVLGASLL